MIVLETSVGLSGCSNDEKGYTVSRFIMKVTN